jgi:hypothetical protein
MFKLLFVVIVIGLAAWLFSQLLPDIQRYMRLRSM